MRDFRLETVDAGADRAVLRVWGEVDVYTAPMLRERVMDLAAKGAVHVLLDMRGVEFLDSTGLGALVACLKRLRTQDGSMGLSLESERILRIFRITGLTQVFTPHPTVAAAVDADPGWHRAAAAEAGSTAAWCARHDLT